MSQLSSLCVTTDRAVVVTDAGPDPEAVDIHEVTGCGADGLNPAAKGGVFLCWLTRRHKDAHWDDVDRVWWVVAA